MLSARVRADAAGSKRLAFKRLTMSTRCPACDHENRSDARFCQRCGQSLSEPGGAPAPVPRRRPRRAWPTGLALLIAGLSLAFNLYLLSQLTQFRAAALTVVDGGSALLEDVEQHGLAVDVSISQTIPIERDWPVKLNLDWPLKVEVPINTTVNVPINLGALGTRVVRIPINTVVPISVVVPIRLDRSFYISLSVPLSLTVPIRVAPDQPPLDRWLPILRERLLQVRQQLDGETVR
jgi:hypothetical protein